MRQTAQSSALEETLDDFVLSDLGAVPAAVVEQPQLLDHDVRREAHLREPDTRRRGVRVTAHSARDGEVTDEVTSDHSRPASEAASRSLCSRSAAPVRLGTADAADAVGDVELSSFALCIVETITSVLALEGR